MAPGAFIMFENIAGGANGGPVPPGAAPPFRLVNVEGRQYWLRPTTIHYLQPVPESDENGEGASGAGQGAQGGNENAGGSVGGPSQAGDA